jgi:hypothetical protein
MSLVVPQCVLQTINKFERSFFWAGMDKVLGGQCKVNWKIVCKSKERGGLGIIDLDKFARALRLKWPWLIWKDRSKAFIGADHPCDDVDMEFFYAATTITIGDGRIASFWHAPWLDGVKPKDIAPSILTISRRKNFTVNNFINWKH